MLKAAFGFVAVLGFSLSLHALEHEAFERSTPVAIEQARLSKAEKAVILAAAAKAADHEERTWWDTILEGDYALTGHAEAHEITLHFLNNQRIGYSVYISAPAVTMVGEACSYSEDSQSWVGEGCEHGNIQVMKYYDLDWAEVDADTYPEFD